MERLIYDIKDIMSVMNISRNTAYKLMRQVAIPHIRIGNRYKIPAHAFHSWLKNRQVGLISDPDGDMLSAVSSVSDRPVKEERSVL